MGTEDTISESFLGEARSQLMAKLMAYEAEDIYNVDESGLFFMQMPTRSYVQGELQSKEVKRQKERVTILLSCSLAREKMKPLLIGKHWRPRVLKHIDIYALPCHYKANKNAWLTRAIFSDWVSVLNTQMLLAGRKICLLLDNFSGHKLEEVYSNIELVFLPPGTTSVLQPLDCGIIRSVKARYSALLANKRLKSSDCLITFKPSIKDAVFLIAEAWTSVDAVLIRNCWRKANISNPTLFDLGDAI